MAAALLTLIIIVANAVKHRTYAPSEHICWLKDNRDGLRKEPDRIIGNCGSNPSPPSPTAPPPPSIVNVEVAVNTQDIIGEVQAEYVSYTLDWWSPKAGARPEGWGPNASVLELDFESPRLRALVSALGPAILRIGGSLDKVVVYDMPGTASCPSTSICLNTSRWDALNAFAKDTGSRLVFGLSYPTVGPQSTGVWNSSQSEALFSYAKQQGQTPSSTLYGFELGEELTQYKVGSAAFVAYTQSYHTAAKILKHVFGDDITARPKLMGPCPGMSWPQLTEWYPAFLAGTKGALDVAVYHSYNQVVVNPPRVLYLNETVPTNNLSTQHGASPGGTGWQGKAMSEFAAAADVPIWLGEFGPHNGGGGGEYASTFASSFFYFDALGLLSTLNHSVLARQTLVGGNYELLRCSSGQPNGPEPSAGCDFEPHPDYYIALLWHRLMDPKVLKIELPAAANSTSSLRMYAHCTEASSNGSVSLAFANMDESITYHLNSPFRGLRIEYHVTRTNTSESMENARHVSLNGNPLATTSIASGVVPELNGNWVGESTVVIAPVSIGWVVFPDAGASACVNVEI